MVVRPLGSTHDTLDSVTVFALQLIYCPCRCTDSQQHPVAHKPPKPTWCVVQRESTKKKKKKNHNSFIPPPKKSNANSTIFNLFWGENKSSSQHKQTVRCGRCLGHFTQIKLVCIKQALCVHSSI